MQKTLGRHMSLSVVLAQKTLGRQLPKATSMSPWVLVAQVKKNPCLVPIFYPKRQNEKNLYTKNYQGLLVSLLRDYCFLPCEIYCGLGIAGILGLSLLLLADCCLWKPEVHCRSREHGAGII